MNEKQFDAKIKNIASRENISLPGGYAERLQSLAQNAVNGGVKRVRTRKVRFALIAAAAMILISAVAAYASRGLQSIEYNWKGKPTHYFEIDETIYDVTPAPDIMLQSDYDFVNERAPGELRLANRPEENGGYSSGYGMAWVMEKFSSLPDLREILEAGAPLFPLPSYIPEEYTFRSAQVAYFLSPDLTYPPAETSINPESGCQWMTFKMPDGYRNYIHSYQIAFADANENYLDIVVNLNGSDVKMSFGAGPEAQISTPELKGFSESILRRDSLVEGDAVLHFLALDALKKIPAIQFFDPQELGKRNPRVKIYDSMVCSVHFNNRPDIDDGEPVRILDSLE